MLPYDFRQMIWYVYKKVVCALVSHRLPETALSRRILCCAAVTSTDGILSPEYAALGSETAGDHDSTARYRPPTKSGKTVVFFYLEDESGLVDVTVFECTYQQYGSFIFSERLLTVTGQVDRRGGEGTPVSLTAERITHFYCKDLTCNLSCFLKAPVKYPPHHDAHKA